MKKFQSDLAKDICQRYEPSEVVLNVLEDLGETAAPKELIQALLEGQHRADAATFLAHGMPPREGVWWACHAADYVKQAYQPLDLDPLIDITKTWVRNPNDETRRTAMAKAQEADFDNPASWAAAAAFWSNGSLADPNLPDVPAPDGLYRTAIAAAITMAAVGPENGARAQDHYQHFIRMGMDIADGGSGEINQGATPPAQPMESATPAASPTVAG